MRRHFLAFMLMLMPSVSPALQLSWSSGGSTLSFTEATRCTLVVSASAEEQVLPSGWRLLWVSDCSSIQPLVLDPQEACQGDIAQVFQVDLPITPADSAANLTTAHFCSGGAGAASMALFLLDLPAGATGKLKVAAIDPADPDSSRVLQSSEVTFNGSAEGDYPPLILHASSVHQSDLFFVTARGIGLSSIGHAGLAAPDTSWRLTLSVSQQSDTLLTASASVPALMPASVLELSAPAGGTTVTTLAADNPVAPTTSASIASYIDSTGAYYPKDFAFFYDGLGHFHLFFIRHNGHLTCNQGALNEKYLAHVSSSDLVHWSQPDTTSFTTTQSAGPWDANHVWAPTLIQKGPDYYLFYTGVDVQDNQTIGYAKTQNINTPAINWQRQSTPLFKATNTFWADTTHPQQFRDPFVMPDPFIGGHWLMHVAARKRAGSCDTMLVGVLQSVGTSLILWQDKSPLYMTDFYHTFRCQTESPHAFMHINAGHVPVDSTWYLLDTSEASPASIRLLRNKHSPIDPSEVFGPNNWTAITSLYSYLYSDPRVAGWIATEYLNVHGAEYLAGFIADTQADCRMVPGTFGRIEIAELQWRSSSSSMPDSFSLAPVVTAGVEGASGDQGDEGVGLRLVGLRPGSGRVKFRAELPAPMRIRLELFDVMGRQVRTLAKGDALEGSTDIAWDGRDGKGRAAASGVYFARLVCRAGVRTVRVPLVR
jgi:hypothetical protein